MKDYILKRASDIYILAEYHDEFSFIWKTEQQ